MPPCRSTIGSAVAVWALALLCALANGCGTIREKLADKGGATAATGDEAPRAASGAAKPETQVVVTTGSAPRPLSSADRSLAPIAIEQAGATSVDPGPRLKAFPSNGEAGAFTPVRPAVDGSIRLVGQDLLLPGPQPAPPGSEPAAPGDVPPGDPEQRRIRIPTAGSLEGEPLVDITSHDDRISLVVRDAPVGTVLALVAQQQGLNVIASEDIPTRVSVTLRDVRLDDALNTLLTVAGYTWVRRNDIVVVSRISADNRLAPHLQGRAVRVLPLSFVAATDVEKVVAGLLSPIGTVQIIESSSVDKRRTEESIVVEDLPPYLERVEAYVAQIDQPPRQVLVEAHVLQVDLDDSCRHGVNFEFLGQVAGTGVSLRTTGFSDSSASPAFFLGLDNEELDALLEALRSTTNARTLASPKVLVVNGQEARIQIGESLGYFVTTTTETSTLQNVDFLELGVVLTVTPVISRDGRVLMTVKPEVSSGQINPVTGLPEEDTTEVETTVMLGDGQAMVIGGLIKEEDIDQQSRLPFLGGGWRGSFLFKRRTAVRRRQEVIVALVPRIVPFCGPAAHRELEGIDRATTPLLTPDLERVPRPWEPLPER